VRERIAVEQPPPPAAPAPTQERAATHREGPVEARVQQGSETGGDQAGEADAAGPWATLDEEIEAAVADPPASLGEQVEAAESSDLVKESLQIAGSYDPEGRFDPFEPLFKSQPEVQVAVEGAERRERRAPQTPLERVALSQLKVTAIIRAPSGNRALVEDNTGKGYVVTKGTYIGLNSGRVIDIDAGRIVVEEEIETIMGELKIQLAELKLQKPAGEL
jgi:type IV pilus assembly protein PilP